MTFLVLRNRTLRRPRSLLLRPRTVPRLEGTTEPNGRAGSRSLKRRATSKPGKFRFRKAARAPSWATFRNRVARAGRRSIISSPTTPTPSMGLGTDHTAAASEPLSHQAVWRGTREFDPGEPGSSTNLPATMDHQLFPTRGFLAIARLRGPCKGFHSHAESGDWIARNRNENSFSAVYLVTRAGIRACRTGKRAPRQEEERGRPSRPDLPPPGSGPHRSVRRVTAGTEGAGRSGQRGVIPKHRFGHDTPRASDTVLATPPFLNASPGAAMVFAGGHAVGCTSEPCIFHPQFSVEPTGPSGFATFCGPSP